VSAGDLGPGFGTAYHPEPDPLPNGHAASAGPVSLRGLPRRRRPLMILLAVALVGVGILASAALYQRASHQVPVLVVTRTVPAGERITAADLGTASITAGAGVATIPGRQLDQVTGRLAAGRLTPGRLLTPADLTSHLPPGPGQELVPVALRPSTLPAGGLAPGDQILIIATPGYQGQPGSGGSGAGPGPSGGSGSGGGPGSGGAFPSYLSHQVPAVVERVNTAPTQDGFDVVDLLVPARDAASVGEQASTGYYALLVTKQAG
jgi:hypothetical protein